MTRSGKPSRSTEILGLSEKVVYYTAAVFLLVTVVMLFVSAGASVETSPTTVGSVGFLVECECSRPPPIH